MLTHVDTHSCNTETFLTAIDYANTCRHTFVQQRNFFDSHRLCYHM